MDRLNLFPAPKTLVPGKGTLPFKLPLSIQAGEHPSPRFRSAIEAVPFLEEQDAPIAPSEWRIECGLIDCEDFSDENYQLKISSEGIALNAKTETGWFRGLTTLGQIVRECRSALPCLLIEDGPELSERGYMLDISRCKVPTQDALYELVDTLAILKYNQLQLYTEHTFAYRNHQIVWENASPLKAEEIQSLDTYCYNRYIELIPNQNSFGHMDRWLRHGAYKHLAECPNGYTHPLLGPIAWGGTLKPDEESIDFVSKLYDELLPNFRSNRVNVGGDEPWELGQGWSEEFVKERGKHRVYIDHLLQIYDLVERRGKTMQFWGDIVLEDPELARELPRNCLGIIWGYEANHPFDEQCQVFGNSGIPFYVAPGTTAWNSIGGRIQNSLHNIREACRQAVNLGAQGMLLTDWGDFGHHQFPFTSYHAIIEASALSWNQSSNGEYNLDDAVDSTFLHGKSSATAKAILELSKIVNSFEYRPHNRTLLNDLLMSKGRKLKDQLSHTTSGELEQCRERLIKFISSMKADQPSWKARDLVSRELLFTSELLEFATRKGLMALSETGGDLQEERARLVKGYRSLWLARNRPGGLDESAAYLEKT